MNITRIDLAGENANFAVITRKAGSKYIDVEILTPDGCPRCGEHDHDQLAWQDDETVKCLNCDTHYRPADQRGGSRTHHVQADDENDQQSMAECLQQALDGFEGTRGDVAAYFRIIQMLADPPAGRAG